MGAIRRIACIGDSLTEQYAAALQGPTVLDDSVRVENLGVGGSTLLRSDCQGRSWMDTTQFSSLVAEKWDHAYVMFGTNDIQAECETPECWMWPLLLLAGCATLTLVTLGILACRAATVSQPHSGCRLPWYARVPWMALSICAAGLVMVAATTGAVCDATNGESHPWEMQWECFDGPRPGLECEFAQEYLALLRRIEHVGVPREHTYIMSPPPAIWPCPQTSGRSGRTAELAHLVRRISVAAGVRFVDLYGDFGGASIEEYRCGSCAAAATSNASSAWKLSCGLLQEDGVHLSPSGVQLVIERLRWHTPALQRAT